MLESEVSRYGLISVDHSRNHHWISFFLPRDALSRLQLSAGSGVLIQGLQGKSGQIQLRPATVAQNYSRLTAFTATARFQNRKGAIGEFLSSAGDRGIIFSSIVTEGSRSGSAFDLVLEGVIPKLDYPHFEQGKAIAAELEKASGRAGGTVLVAHPIFYRKPLQGGSPDIHLFY